MLFFAGRFFVCILDKLAFLYYNNMTVVVTLLKYQWIRSKYI